MGKPTKRGSLHFPSFFTFKYRNKNITVYDNHNNLKIHMLPNMVSDSEFTNNISDIELRNTIPDKIVTTKNKFFLFIILIFWSTFS